ncbi:MULTISPECIES: HlyD family secretion protein [Commensalibacter]|uniref:Transporter EamA n=2 Tax=Commensalibacter TaxID=1079922 RepID=W7E2D8_9PROT|nr:MULTISPECIES: HlyD family efflux transporter periplasmic adaptor subunit [Commensalibacter]EUK19274.1 transporter EamA [Commensalibacter papalotli (ex Servin-Garciduenas et al. 2014)]CAI3932377.1 Multidrug resistance efflux pump EmrA (EmrA) (PDB:4TKO) [Commensalibacter papalotli (ex Botero et al. 2024)]CAI3946311.1 Multidrug resistance efflux pump EmrA (EmrA) (PDB:4TKO) [Commensalibacter papalotli (ex Botero et al. 2024)]
MSSLFRPEVLEAKRDTWLGKVQDIQPIPIKIISVISLVFTILVILYIYYGGYTRRTHAIGSMMPVSGLITVGSRANGVIIEKNIKEGQFVQKGQKLFAISLENNNINGPAQEQINKVLKKQKQILIDQYNLRKNNAPIEKENITSTLANLYRQHQKVTNQINQDNIIIPKIQSSLTMIEKAKKLALATNIEYQNQLYTYAQILSTHSQFLQNQTSIEGQILDNIAKLRLFDSTLKHDLYDIQQKIAQTEEKIIQGEKDQTIIVTAPTSGNITALRGYIGQQVTPTSALLSIVPEGQQLEAELYVPSSAVGLLKKNDTVVLSYSAFPYQKFGLYKGIVSEITYTPITSETMGKEDSERLKNEFANQNAEGDHNLYRVRVKPNEQYIMGYHDQKLYLKPGMRVEADIAIDYRRLYQWMLNPFIKVKDTVKTRLVKPTP